MNQAQGRGNERGTSALSEAYEQPGLEAVPHDQLRPAQDWSRLQAVENDYYHQRFSMDDGRRYIKVQGDRTFDVGCLPERTRTIPLGIRCRPSCVPYRRPVLETL
ncbi:hypothetical protein LZ30DRAFT_734492 [Colletotrichum cereale]|nr:hypothetical protein LZ30DRAFT_734492 [Colletotrichum cereale]